MYERFTDRARKVMQLANQEAQRLHHEYIGTEHILLGLVKEGSGVAANVLKNLNVDLQKIRLEVEKLVQTSLEVSTPGKLPQTPRAKQVVEYAIEEARNLNHNYVGTEHLLLGLIREEEAVASQVLQNLGLRLNEVRDEVGTLLGRKREQDEERSAKPCESFDIQPVKGKSKTPALDSFGRDLTTLARQGNRSPLVGRAGEIERMLVILCGRTRPCVLLVGEAGVGKKALVQGLAERVAGGGAPGGLPVERVVALDLGVVPLGTERWWQARERLQAILHEARQTRTAVSLEAIPLLYVEQDRGLAGLFEAALRQQPPMLIAAVTPAEHREHFAQHPDRADLFEPLFIKPLSEADALEVLRGQREAFEAHHHVSITDEALTRSVELAELSLPGPLPGKALRLLDRAAGLVRLRTYVPAANLKDLDTRLEQTVRQKEEAVAEQDFDRAAALRDEGDRLRKRREHLVREWEHRQVSTNIVGAESVAEALTRMTQGQESRLRSRESEDR